jgi:predicted ATPase with chaperone activity
MDRLAKVSRTVADLEGADEIQPAQVVTASSFVIGGLLRDAF